MSTNLDYAVQITVIGMGLVFASIILLWALMALLVRITADRAQPDHSASEQEAAEQALKQQAAALAVAVAIRLHEAQAHSVNTFPVRETPQVSAWQAVTRARQLRRGPRQ